MLFEDLPEETQHDIHVLGYQAEIEDENDKRLQCTRLGYRLGGRVGMVICMVCLLYLSGAFALALVMNSPTGMAMNPLFWLIFLPAALIPFVPFVFLKLRYAVRAFAFVILVFIITLMLLGGLQSIGRMLI